MYMIHSYCKLIFQQWRTWSIYSWLHTSPRKTLSLPLREKKKNQPEAYKLVCNYGYRPAVWLIQSRRRQRITTQGTSNRKMEVCLPLKHRRLRNYESSTYSSTTTTPSLYFRRLQELNRSELHKALASGGWEHDRQNQLSMMGDFMT